MWEIRDFDSIMHEQFSELWKISDIIESTSQSMWSEYKERIINSFNPLSQDFPPAGENPSKADKDRTHLNEKQIQTRIKFMWF